MKTPNPDLDPFLAALQADLPSAQAEARVRARLLAAGLALTGAAVTSSSGAATSLGTASSSGAAGLGAATSGAAGSAAASGSLAAGASTSVMAGSGMAAANIGAGSAPAALVKLGLFSKLLLLPAVAKVGVASTLVVVAAATTVPLVLEARHARPATSQSPSVGASVPQDPTPIRPDHGAAPAPLPASAESRDVGTSRAGAPAQAPRIGTPTPAPTATRAPTRAASHAVTRAPVAALQPRRNGSGRDGGLSEEARLMEAAMLALHEDDRELAERTLAEHARRFPNGLLERERERALSRLRQK
jgi:hypothetical protein